MWSGLVWGMVATAPMTVTHVAIWAVAGRLSVVALTSQALPSIIITSLLVPLLLASVHLLLAPVLHFGSGGFWGGVLFGLTPGVSVWKGLALVAFLHLGAHLVMPFLSGTAGPWPAGRRTEPDFYCFRWHRISPADWG